MRAFNPYRVILRAGSLVDQNLALTDGAVGSWVELLDTYRAVSVVLGLAVGCVVIVHNIGASVVIEEEGGVDATYRRQAYRLRPFSKGILCGDEEVAPSHVGGHHIVGLVVRVVLDGRSKDAAAHMLGL